MQAMLMLLFPVTLAPIALAYLARYAFGSEWAFFGVLLFGAVLGGIAYWFSMESAVKTAGRRTEEIIAALSQGDGLIQS
jgi:ABC-2 type transport system permease protein